MKRGNRMNNNNKNFILFYKKKAINKFYQKIMHPADFPDFYYYYSPFNIFLLFLFLYLQPNNLVKKFEN